MWLAAPTYEPADAMKSALALTDPWRRTSAAGGGGLVNTSVARLWKSLSGACGRSGSVSQGSCLEYAGVLALRCTCNAQELGGGRNGDA